MTTIAVTGASGHFGRKAVELLLEAGQKPIAITRSPDSVSDLAAKGAEVRIADFAQPETLDLAFGGVDRLLIVATHEVGELRIKRHAAAINAAARAGIEYVVYTSGVRTRRSEDPIENDHAVSEEDLAASGLAYTAVRENLFMDLVFEGLPPAVATGELRAPAGDAGVGMVTRDDCVRASVALLMKPQPATPTVIVTGPELVTYEQLAAIASEVSGRPVRYISETPDETKARLRGFGLPEDLIGVFLSVHQGIARGAFEVTTTTVADLTGIPAQSVRDYLLERRADL